MIFLPNLIVHNNNAYFEYQTNLDTDRYSLFLYNTYDSAVNTDSKPPAIEDYGCILPPPANNSNDYFNASSFNGNAKVVEICPSYQTAKLSPVKYNPNNFLINQFGIENFTWYQRKALATPFVTNGFLNTNPCPGGGEKFGSPCSDLNLIKYTGFETGPRSYVLSKDVLISASHYWSNPIGSQIQYIGSNNTVYTATVVDFARLTNDVILLRITGLESAVTNGYIKPIATFNYDVDYDLRYLLLYQKMLPIFSINMDNMVGLINEQFYKDPILRFGDTTINPLYNIFDFFNTESLFNLLEIDYCTSQDYMLFGGCGTSSSPLFVIHENIPVLVKCRFSSNDINYMYDELTFNEIDQQIQSWNCQARTKITVLKENIINKINKFKRHSTHDDHILIKLVNNVEVIENTDNTLDFNEEKFAKNITLQNINNLDNFVFNSMSSIANPNDQIFAPILSVSGCNFYENNTKYLDNTGTVEIKPQSFDCLDPLKIVYNLYSPTVLNSINFIKNSEINFYNSNDLKEFYKQYFLNNKIVLKKNKKYYITFTLSLDSPVGNKFYFTTEKNNKQKIYSKQIYKYKNLYYEQDEKRKYFVSKIIENLYNQELPVESLPQPFDINNYNVVWTGTCPDSNNSYNGYDEIVYSLLETQYATQLFTIIFDVPSDCPSKLYLCFEDSPESYIEIFCEPQTETLKKDAAFSYLTIKAAKEIESSDEIKIGTTIANSGLTGYILGYYISCYENWDPNLPIPNTPKAIEEIFNAYFAYNKNNAIFDPSKDFVKHKQIKYGVSAKDDFTIDISREE